MKIFQSVLALSLILAAGTGLAVAHEPESKPAAQQEKMDHDQMNMDHGNKADADFTQLDLDKNGKVSKDEVPANSPTSKHFDMLDTDKDGNLSPTEFAKHHEM